MHETVYILRLEGQGSRTMFDSEHVFEISFNQGPYINIITLSPRLNVFASLEDKIWHLIISMLTTLFLYFFFARGICQYILSKIRNIK